MSSLWADEKCMVRISDGSRWSAKLLQKAVAAAKREVRLARDCESSCGSIVLVLAQTSVNRVCLDRGGEAEGGAGWLVGDSESQLGKSQGGRQPPTRLLAHLPATCSPIDWRDSDKAAKAGHRNFKPNVTPSVTALWRLDVFTHPISYPTF